MLIFQKNDGPHDPLRNYDDHDHDFHHSEYHALHVQMMVHFPWSQCWLSRWHKTIIKCAPNVGNSVSRLPQDHIKLSKWLRSRALICGLSVDRWFQESLDWDWLVSLANQVIRRGRVLDRRHSISRAFLIARDLSILAWKITKISQYYLPSVLSLFNLTSTFKILCF